MIYRIVGFLVLLLALPALGAEDDRKDKLDTPAQLYQALVKEADKAQQDYNNALGEASGQERAKLRKNRPNFGPRFVALAEKYPKDPAAVDALVRVVTDHFSRDAYSDVSKALNVLLRDHVGSEKLAGVCDALSFRVDQQDAETFLLAVLEKSPRKNVQAEACLALAHLSHLRVDILQELKDPDKRNSLTKSYGAETIQALEKLDAKQQTAESQKYFRLFVDKYSGELAPSRVAEMCLMLADSNDGVSEEVLRSLLATDARTEDQGAATLFLAKVLSDRASSLAGTESAKAAKLLAESETLLERAANKYADVRLEYFGSVGKKAKRELFALRYLSIGKVAPDIEGEEQYGKRFKLSDYRGKVVRLDFLELGLRRLSGLLAPRAVAREETRKQALRPHWSQRQSLQAR